LDTNVETIGDNVFGIGALTARIMRLESQVRAQEEALNAMAKQLGIDPVVAG